MERPETRFAWHGDAALAYQVLGRGGLDLVVSQSWVTNVELFWEHALPARFFRELSRNRRVIVMDPRGHGCSERASSYDIWPLETLVQDLLAVLDDTGSERALILGMDMCGPVACMFGATYPERTSGLILYETAANWLWSEETPWEWMEEQWEALERDLRGWGTSAFAVCDVERNDPSLVTDSAYVEWWRRLQLGTCAPGHAVASNRKYMASDVRSILDSIHVPVQVLLRPDNPQEWEQSARYLVQRIAGAKLRVLSGRDRSLWVGDTSAVLETIDAFAASIRDEEAELERVLATVLFTDIVGSTEKLAALGNADWRRLVESHHAAVRALIERFRGREMDTVGDGFYATFDGPARAIRCAQAIVDAVRPLGIEVRAGLHTGECEIIDGKVGGMAVNIGARVASIAHPSEVLVSQTVKDLVVGSGLAFEDRGEHELKGVEGPWRLYRVVS